MTPSTIIASGDAHPIPPNEGPTIDRGDAIDGATTNAMGLLDLMRWVTEARQAVSNLEVMIQFYPELADRLREAKIFIGELTWDEHETFGLQRLHLCIRDELRSTRAASGLTPEAQQ